MVHSPSLHKRSLALLFFAVIPFAWLLAPAPKAHAQAAAEAANPHNRILLVLPFDNNTNQPNLEWIREAAPELLTSRFLSAGLSPLSRADRLYALDHLGFPESFHPSRATSIKLAQTLDADSIIVGSYSISGSTLTAQARIVNVPRLHMTPAVSASGDLHSLIAVFDTLAWELTRELDPSFNVSEETFVAAGSGLRVESFEQYIRGISEPDHTERLRHLQAAVQLSPNFAPAWMALAREEYAAQDYDHAAEAYAKVTANTAASSPDALEANFYRGLSLLFTGHYADAEAAFSAVSRVLPLAAVLNNQAVAISRQNHDATALYRQAIAADPGAPDYHFNLAVSLKRNGDAAGAKAELAQYLKLRPNDSEAQDLRTAWNNPAPAAPAAGTATTTAGTATPAASAPTAPDPLERINRTFDASAFRQAAAVMAQMESARLAALPPEQRARALDARARDYLSRGLLLEAERLFRNAAEIDPHLADAHEGLAEVRERSGDVAGARAEAQAALAIRPTPETYLVLARLDLAGNHFSSAIDNVNHALALSPNSAAAKNMLQRIADKQSHVK